MKFLALTAALLAPSFAMAQANCAPRAFAEERLRNTFGEVIQSRGILRGAILEMWANTETGTWTAVVTTPDGRSCVVAAGQDFESVLEPGGDPA